MNILVSHQAVPPTFCNKIAPMCVLLHEEIGISSTCSLYNLDAKLNAVNKQTSFENDLVSAYGQE